MSEYWVSTPTYWCKFCQTYVRDTKNSKQQHEATGRHQGNVQRSIRTLQKNQDQESRAQQRAKDEIARLNGIVSGKKDPANVKSSSVAAQAPQPKRQATKEERERQIEQLSQLGVAIPDEFRRDMAISGDWQDIRPVVREETKPDVKSIGVHKRKLDEEDEEDEAASAKIQQNKSWGSKFRSLDDKDSEVDFDALLKPAEDAPKKKKRSAFRRVDEASAAEELQADDDDASTARVKTEPSDEFNPDLAVASEDSAGLAAGIKDEEGSNAPPAVVFKKRKGKVGKT